MLDRLFCDLNYFAECASGIAIEKYKEKIRSQSNYAEDGSEQGVYFCAISKSLCESIETAICILFVYTLFYNEQWFQEDCDGNSNLSPEQWKEVLKKEWIPMYFSCKGKSGIEYTQTDKIEGMSIKDSLLHYAIQSPVVSIFRYGDIKAWNFYEYIIETKEEYILFESWTTG